MGRRRSVVQQLVWGWFVFPVGHFSLLFGWVFPLYLRLAWFKQEIMRMAEGRVARRQVLPPCLVLLFGS